MRAALALPHRIRVLGGEDAVGAAQVNHVLILRQRRRAARRPRARSTARGLGTPNRRRNRGPRGLEDEAQVLAGLAAIAGEDQPVVGLRGNIAERRRPVDAEADVEVAEGEQTHADAPALRAWMAEGTWKLHGALPGFPKAKCCWPGPVSRSQGQWFGEQLLAVELQRIWPSLRVITT